MLKNILYLFSLWRNWIEFIFPVVLYFSIYENSYSFIIFYEKKNFSKRCLNYSITFSNVPRLQSFLLDNILRIDYKARIMWITLTAMICPLGLCTILLTDPYAPLPISPRSLRSSAVKSQCCSGEIFSFPEDSMLCVRSRSLKRMSQCFYAQKLQHKLMKLHHQTELQKLWLLPNRFPEICQSVIG